MANFQERIKNKYPSLSSGNKKVGKYVLDNPQSIAMKSASQLGQEVGVSETTVIRFCYALEYSGYSELQNEVRNYLIFQKSSLHEYQADKEGMADKPNFFAQSMGRDMANISEVMENLDEADLNRAVRKIYNSNNIMVTGIRTSFAIAHWLSFTLNIIKGNSHLINPGIDDFNHLLSKLDSGSILIAITFHRYSSMTLGLAESAKKQGAFVIGITDSPLSPLAEFSDVLLPIGLSTRSTIDSAPPVFSLVNAIVAGVSVIDKKGFEQRRDEYEKFNPGYFFM
ncbi:MurR/RpiR family transcriptional regulator [Bacillus sp. T33-2]|uniref:MurR/RpiR family transcriptional regulator n=1 Tax=Bacillus sp. T33-2 TaxID=2054168 RepID=UPI000C77345C|nr:MurR/RpiR family transcriptional regulator [Bacillus sp. T33-2]PLR95969.1 MurR/RpiR family transcriptional regulator [Bacillus sp. T33-2]